MKKISFVIVFIILLTSIRCFALSARSAVVLDCASGRILFSQNGNEKRGMASTTKIMTAITALENTDLSKTVTISPTASGVEGSSMYLAKGEKLTLEELVYGLMLVSGNDAATAIAEAVSGSVEKFSGLMNEKASKIGAINTSFTNPHGLSDENHYTTALDLAKITAYALENPKFAEIVSTKIKKLPQSEGGIARTLVNHNKFLNMYEGCIGVKTGFTKATGRCLVTAVEKDGMKLVCVTLNAPDDWNDHKELYNKAFSEYLPYQIKSSGEKITDAKIKRGTADTVPLVASEDIFIPLKSGEEQLIKTEIRVFEDLSAPVAKGDTLGSIDVSLDGKLLAEFPLIAGQDIAEKKQIFKKNESNVSATLKNLIFAWLTCFK
ncbi:MAG: D-alanyl-D-alanine carboxypeptidase [Ruminococcaceae bacterium]|nr:D-alanyl-D-alanine carboxypeptidase [Oscillospiraceae bacterium]